MRKIFEKGSTEYKQFAALYKMAQKFGRESEEQYALDCWNCGEYFRSPVVPSSKKSFSENALIGWLLFSLAGIQDPVPLDFQAGTPAFESFQEFYHFVQEYWIPPEDHTFESDAYWKEAIEQAEMLSEKYENVVPYMKTLLIVFLEFVECKSLLISNENSGLFSRPE